MPIVRYKASEIDTEALLAQLAARPVPSEEEIESHAIEDGGAWTDEELANAVLVYPPPTPAEVQALRGRFGMSQVEFARCFGFTVDAIQQYEQGRRRPSGAAVTLLRVIAADPDAVARALGRPRAA